MPSRMAGLIGLCVVPIPRHANIFYHKNWLKEAQSTAAKVSAKRHFDAIGKLLLIQVHAAQPPAGRGLQCTKLVQPFHENRPGTARRCESGLQRLFGCHWRFAVPFCTLHTPHAAQHAIRAGRAFRDVLMAGVKA